MTYLLHCSKEQVRLLQLHLTTYLPNGSLKRVRLLQLHLTMYLLHCSKEQVQLLQQHLTMCLLQPHLLLPMLLLLLVLQVLLLGQSQPLSRITYPVQVLLQPLPAHSLTQLLVRRLLLLLLLLLSLSLSHSLPPLLHQQRRLLHPPLYLGCSSNALQHPHQ
jgi:hypothetical protein